MVWRHTEVKIIWEHLLDAVYFAFNLKLTYKKISMRIKFCKLTTTLKAIDNFAELTYSRFFLILFDVHSGQLICKHFLRNAAQTTISSQQSAISNE
ncbi:hypothetical protein [Okeania sp. KiyG1]|uniref:hypothetical protein n=1 Tax=Okeania sp. KiyG1 TaxID=2720165 RepID=UPI0019237792|nr:hypothetical protein [Okeania sp. KiyG1]GGA39444.1 hypothetical protein CYANOKiyG1_57660 [Okeania sp. KiyG1]